MTNSVGSFRLLELAARQGALFLLASTSEVYGDPEVHPQPETYWGNVNPIGPRACYDEGKRFAEALTINYIQHKDVDGRIVRIFNTYGPRNDPEDGRVIPNFFSQALTGRPITVYGEGRQSRSFCYVSDLVEGLLRAMFSQNTTAEVFNLGNPDEYEIITIAERIRDLAASSSEIQRLPARAEEIRRRRPDIDKAERMLAWSPTVGLDEGLRLTLDWFREALASRVPAPSGP